MFKDSRIQHQRDMALDALEVCVTINKSSNIFHNHKFLAPEIQEQGKKNSEIFFGDKIYIPGGYSINLYPCFRCK